VAGVGVGEVWGVGDGMEGKEEVVRRWGLGGRGGGAERGWGGGGRGGGRGGVGEAAGALGVAARREAVGGEECVGGAP
jgi:hypothetical protein